MGDVAPTTSGSDTGCEVAPRHRLWLAAEFLLVLFALPTLAALKVWPWNPLILGIVVGVAATWWLLTRSGFPRQDLYRLPNPGRNLAEILALFVVGGSILTLLVWLYLPPEQRFALPRHRPTLWLRLMILYPLISVYPQELFFRGCVFERYRPLFRSSLSMLLAGTLAFAYAHVVFRNWVAPTLCIGGGLLFGYRYLKTRSLLWASIEHALWGMLILSIGLEHYFLTATAFLLGGQRL